jgi:hypothetical protein
MWTRLRIRKLPIYPLRFRRGGQLIEFCQVVPRRMVPASQAGLLLKKKRLGLRALSLVKMLVYDGSKSLGVDEVGILDLGRDGFPRR